MRDDGTLVEAHDPGITNAEAVDLYRWMVLTRQIDERLVALQRQGRIGFHIGSVGEEAAVLGAAFAMRKQDFIFPCYREFGAALMRGLPLQTFLDNMYGNENDAVKGRQMPDHYTCRDANWVSISSPVGTQISQAVGFAWAAKLRKEDQSVLVYFGDGATSSNDFHTGMNFAGVFDAPVIFFCRNNGWAISVPTERQTASRTFADKAVAYGVESVRVDGNDVFAVISVTRRALARATAGDGPTLIEALTYRMGGHSTSDDPDRYRETDEVEPWVDRDPIERMRHFLESRGDWDESREQEHRADVDKRFKEAVERAEAAPPPPLSSLFEDVYAEPSWNLIEQRTEVEGGPRPPKQH